MVFVCTLKHIAYRRVFYGVLLLRYIDLGIIGYPSSVHDIGGPQQW